MKAVTIILALCFAGCAHYSYIKMQPYSDFEEAAVEETEQIEPFLTSQKAADVFEPCIKMKKKSKREDCYLDKLTVSFAKINLIYVYADKRKIMDKYHASKDEVIDRFQRDYKTCGVEKEIYDFDRNFAEIYCRIKLYEFLARTSHEVELAYGRYKSHADAVGDYNNAVYNQAIAQAAAWNSISNTLNQMSTDRRINHLESQQRQLEWQQRNSDGKSHVNPY